MQLSTGAGSGWTDHWDDVAKVPYKTKGNYFLSYDNERSVGEKAQYIKDNGLAGVIIWQVYGDMTNMTSSTVPKGKLIYCPNTTHPLVNKINAVFATGGRVIYRPR
ncbi:glycosyl hydrolase family 18 protein [Paraflavitalea speifideaquila]|uniref:glycosyl hydrolase family 18 protein n=1 Tax=Paraflavitalea speifideaquila TaxID=3076558 RepID=UPI0028EF12CE|nr:glycosyl hydrolase family 18 protein [Paraflavitalea speifideiaquila]